MADILLEVQGLTTSFITQKARQVVVDDLSFTLAQGETLAIVGESGCGKSMTALSLMGLVPPPGRVTGGSVRYQGHQLVGMSEAQLRGIRGSQLGMIFQEPVACLNPSFTIGRQLAETVGYHHRLDRRQAREEAVRLLERVGIADPRRVAGSYAHQLSGGMCQRVMIAMTISMSPRILIADEPTTSLDVTIQAQIMSLLARLSRESGTAVLLITHDMGLVAQSAQRVLVMYAGQAVEYTDVARLFRAPAHPYTRGLLSSIPAPGNEGRPLSGIPGMVPALGQVPAGCAFAPRCPQAVPRCAIGRPQLIQVSPGHWVRCFIEQEASVHE